VAASQSAFINSTRTSGSSTQLGQRVPEYHCMVYGCRKGGPFEQTRERAVTNLSIQHSCGISPWRSVRPHLHGGSGRAAPAACRPTRCSRSAEVRAASRQATSDSSPSYGRRFASRGTIELCLMPLPCKCCLVSARNTASPDGGRKNCVH